MRAMLWILSTVTAVGLAQAPGPPAGTIAGQVVDATRGRPVSAAVVTLGGAGVQHGEPRILSSADGRFVFKDLPPGNFTIAAAKSGYAEGSYGRHRPGGTVQAVILTESTRSADVAIRIWKHAAIAGTVVDEAGEPVVGLQLRALVSALAGGRRRFSHAAGAVTDDRGAYRFSNLTPGEYKVVASPPAISVRATPTAAVVTTMRAFDTMGQVAATSSGGRGLEVGDALIALGRGMAIPPPPMNGRVQIYPPTFHPSTLVPAQSPAIAVEAGEERSGIDIQLQPVLTARLAGTVAGPAGQLRMVSLRLVPLAVDDVDPGGLTPVAGADAEGNFVFAAVVPGEYRLRANARDGGEMYWLDMPISVRGDVDGATALMQRALSISGRFEFEGTAPRPQRGPAAVMLEPIDGQPAIAPGPNQATLTASGFTLHGYPAGRYLLRPSGSPGGWMFKSAIVNGVDVSETPLDLARDVTDVVITFTDRWTGIGGTVQGRRDGPAVVVFPTDAQAWTADGASPRRLKFTRANAQGRFGVSALPPGDYFVAAIAEEQSADWRDPRVLEALSRVATRVTIGEGEHRTIDLQVREARQ